MAASSKASRLVLATRSSSAAGPESDDPAQTLEIRPSADPVLRWSEEEVEYSTFAAVSGDTILALIADSRKTMVHDMATRVDIPGPRLRCSKRRPAMLPVGDATVLVMDTSLHPRSSCFEALRRVPGGGWRADPLPNPPVADQDRHGRFPYPCVSAYFARGSRAWISVSMAGTFSLDTERGTWRMEGTWELPLCDRGLFVPELGLVFGIASRGIKPTDPEERCCQVCALDVEAGRPPVVRHVWEIPPERVEDVAPWGGVSLAYLGNGRFCVSRSVIVRGMSSSSSEDRGTSFALLDVTRLPDGDLQLAEHGKLHCHVWPWSHSGHAIFLQPA